MTDEPLVGEIRMFAGNFAPAGWALCQGQVLQIAEYQALFSLIGTTYGGDGERTFLLPDLQGRVPIHQGRAEGLSEYLLGQVGGAEAVTLTEAELPPHSHVPRCSSRDGRTKNPAGQVWAPDGSGTTAAFDPSVNDAMSPGALAPSGGGQPHSNIQPFLGANFIIALKGVVPDRG